MIPAVEALTAAKKKQAVANAITSATETPVVGWLMAGAAVVSVLAAMASIPEFATGGIVGGNSFVGDNVLAKVNSGEMILNRQQQGNLFNIINSGRISNSSGKEVEFVIKGQNLVGVLSNYNKKISKAI